MELRLLRYFLAVAREQSFTRAARYLHVTQPTLSRQLMDLEEELGQRLLNRETHTITLTPEGRLLRRRAEDILSLVDKTASDFRAMGESIAGDIYLGGGESKAMSLLADTLAELHADYPDIRYHLYTGVAGDVLERLDKGLLDFGVLLQPIDTSGYDSLTLPVRDRWGILMPREHPLAAREAITVSDLKDTELICPRLEPSHKAVGNPYADWFGQELPHLRIVAIHTLLGNASLLVERGLGLLLTIEPPHPQGRRLCFRPLSPPVFSGTCLVWKRYQVFSQAAATLLNRLREQFDTQRRREDVAQTERTASCTAP